MQHGEADNGREAAVLIGHGCCVSASHGHVAWGEPMLEKIGKSAINLQAFQVLYAVPQPIGGFAGPRPDLENCWTQADIIERAGQDQVGYCASPMVGFIVPAVQSIHLALSFLG